MTTKLTRFLIGAVLILALPAWGCASPGSNTNPTTPISTVYTARATYDAAVLTPAAHYAALPRCPQVTLVCSDQKVVDELRKADAAALAAMDAAETLVRNHPDVDATFAIAAANATVQAAVTILTTYGIK